jgi:hypothetical protein
MSASHQCHARGYTRARYLVVFALSFAWATARADDGPKLAPQTDCNVAAVVSHVQEQFRIYGPKSQKHEYFGFIYRVDGELASAVVRGGECRGPDGCTVDTSPAARRIPRRAKVLGEWHTHAHLNGSDSLSILDVRGAHHNAHIRCYSAYYAGPRGQIHSWNPDSTSVPVAMATRASLGNYGLDAKRDPDAYLATVAGESPAP